MNRARRAILSALFPLALIAAASAPRAYAQDAGSTPRLIMDPSTRRVVLEGIIRRYNETYIFPETAKAMERSLRLRWRRGEYDRIEDAAAFADSLTRHLRAVSGDTHVRVHFSPSPLPPMDEAPHPVTPEDAARRRRDLAWINNGFVKAERLPGNVGLLDLDHFSDPAIAGETAAAAMSFLARCDALIVDLRYNPGGHAGMVALLCSYLVGGDPVHLIDIYSRPENFTKQSWTASYVPGPRFLEKEVYVLTSGRTHSAAEQFAYNLQTLKRASIVGETTRGGAHPTGRYRVTEHFGVAVPESRAISPVTKSNWEGRGVKPDIEVPAPEALKRAHILALERLLNADPPSERAADLRRILDGLRQNAAR